MANAGFTFCWLKPRTPALRRGLKFLLTFKLTMSISPLLDKTFSARVEPMSFCFGYTSNNRKRQYSLGPASLGDIGEIRRTLSPAARQPPQRPDKDRWSEMSRQSQMDNLDGGNRQHRVCS